MSAPKSTQYQNGEELFCSIDSHPHEIEAWFLLSSLSLSLYFSLYISFSLSPVELFSSLPHLVHPILPKHFSSREINPKKHFSHFFQLKKKLRKKERTDSRKEEQVYCNNNRIQSVEYWRDSPSFFSYSQSLCSREKREREREKREREREREKNWFFHFNSFLLTQNSSQKCLFPSNRIKKLNHTTLEFLSKGGETKIMSNKCKN